MSKLVFAVMTLFLSTLVLFSFEAQPARAQSNFYTCTAGLNNLEKHLFAIIEDQTPVQVLNFGYAITSRLSLMQTGELGIEVLHGNKVVSSMVMKRGVTQFVMTAGGIEMNCFPRFNTDFLR